ncbi:hypothetical protein JXB01_00280, partial [Candidatus Micrarchaeota archaeon]|nr:hypothetical protein [Candidatus Micrarchaeota archaeon]
MLKIKDLFAIILFLGLLSATTFTNDSCGYIDTPGYYEVNVSYINGNTDPCIKINASDVILNLNGSILENGTGNFIYVGQNVENVSIANGSISNSTTGVRLDKVNDSFVINLTLQNISSYGIVVGQNSYENNLIGNNMSNISQDSIRSDGERDLIKNNLIDCQYPISLFAGDSPTGIIIHNSIDETLINNTIMNCQRGLRLFQSTNCNLSENNLTGNTFNLDVSYPDSYLGTTQYYMHNVNSSNTVDGKMVNWSIDLKDTVITGNWGLVILINASNVTVSDIDSSHNSHTILMLDSRDSFILSNNASYSNFGPSLHNSTNITIDSNVVNLTSFGSFLQISNSSVLMGNDYYNI